MVHVLNNPNDTVVSFKYLEVSSTSSVSANTQEELLFIVAVRL